METKLETRQQHKVLTGNAAAAYAVRLCQPNVIAAYPITPSTELIEILYRFQAEGSLKSKMVEPEGEHSAMSILIGASVAGGRAFNATSSQGLFFMYEPLVFAAGHRLPIVLVNANRETSPASVASSGQDIVMAKDTGWIQIHVESCQEILDTVLMAFRLAEDPLILVPVTIAYDGYYLSYFSAAVDIPAQEQVDQFLPRRETTSRIDPETPMTMQPVVSVRMFTEYRVKYMAALQRAKSKLEEIEEEFHKMFGRSYGGQIEEYRCEDANLVLVTMGSCVGTARVIVDQKRAQGLKVGLVKVRMFRPFPKERLVKALRGRKAIGVVDRNVCFGWNCGHLFMELRAALTNELEKPVPLLNFIAGLNGGDITLQHMERVVDIMHIAAQGRPHPEVTFLDIE